MSIVEDVRVCEERLLRAMRTSDFAELDALLADDHQGDAVRGGGCSSLRRSKKENP